MTATRPFRAFVSYCHADVKFAAWLQRKLESYRLPRRLADQVQPLEGQAAGRIGPVFRDRADLSAAQDLSVAVKQAIAASSALIVVASPDSANSHWVAREIELFRELHPGFPILVALVRGRPDEALPGALCQSGGEPLAADFQAEGDGTRLAFLKIVAGLADIPLDALVQRDTQRQLRRVIAVTVMVASVAIGMAGLLVLALQARFEAEQQRLEVERQRGGAEGLVEFMLTNLRDELRGLGRPQVMTAVNARALAYYAGQGALEDLPDESLERRARVLHAMGQDDELAGDLDSAFAKFIEARRTTAAILAKQPRNPDRIFAHAQSEFYAGLVAWRRGNRQTATRFWRAYRDQARALVAAEPQSVRSLMEQGYAEAGLCELNLADKHDLPAAARQCEAALRFEEAALREAPGDRTVIAALANRHGWMSRVYLNLGRDDDALANRRAEAALTDRLLEQDPGNFEYALRRIWSDVGTASILLHRKEPAQALSTLQACIRDRAAVLNSSTPDARVVETRLRVHLLAAKALQDLGQPHGQSLASARRDQARMAALGQAFAAKAAAIHIAIWKQGGRDEAN